MPRLTAPRWCLGTMYFGTTVGQQRSYELLDRYVDAGGEWLDTANNYAFWIDGATGDESELLLGGWLRSRRRTVVLASKVGARPRPGSRSLDDVEGLGAAAVREQVLGSLRRLGVDRIDVVYTHVDDLGTPLAETIDAFRELVAAGLVGHVACSNYTVQRLREAGPAYEAIQLRATYLTARSDAQFAPQVEVAAGHLEYAAEHDLVVFGYAALLAGAYAGREVPQAYRHRGTDRQLQAVRDTAERLGVTVNQVVLAWLRSRGVVPVMGVSQVGRLDEAMAAGTLDAQALGELEAARRGE